MLNNGLSERKSFDLLHFPIFMVQMLLPWLNSHYQCNFIGHKIEERCIQSAPMSWEAPAQVHYRLNATIWMNLTHFNVECKNQERKKNV